MTFKSIGRSVAFAVALAGFTAGTLAAQNVIVNGGFESGLLTPGWLKANRAGGTGDVYIDGPSPSPASSHPTPGPHSGSYLAMSDQGGPGTHVLWQDVTIASGSSSAMLSFWMFTNNWAGSTVVGAGLDHTAGPNQHIRVDFMKLAADPFSTAAGDIYLNVFTGGELASSSSNPWRLYTADVTSYVAGGGAFRVRFGEVDNLLWNNMGVDDVRLDVHAGVVPEPATVGLLATGLLGLAGAVRRRRS